MGHRCEWSFYVTLTRCALARHEPEVEGWISSILSWSEVHFTRRKSVAHAPLGPLTLSWSQMDHTGGFLFSVMMQRHHICSSRGQTHAVNTTSTPHVPTLLQHCHRLFSLSCSLWFFLFVVLRDLFLLKRTSSSPLSPDSAHRESCDCRGSIIIIVVASLYSVTSLELIIPTQAASPEVEQTASGEHSDLQRNPSVSRT